MFHCTWCYQLWLKQYPKYYHQNHVDSVQPVRWKKKKTSWKNKILETYFGQKCLKPNLNQINKKKFFQKINIEKINFLRFQSALTGFLSSTHEIHVFPHILALLLRILPLWIPLSSTRIIFFWNTINAKRHLHQIRHRTRSHPSSTQPIVLTVNYQPPNSHHMRQSGAGT